MIKCLNNPEVGKAVYNVMNRNSTAWQLQGMVFANLSSTRMIKEEFAQSRDFCNTDFGSNSALIDAIEALWIQLSCNITNEGDTDTPIIERINNEYTRVLIDKEHELSAGKAVKV